MDKTSIETDDRICIVLDKYANMVYRIAFSWTKNTSDAEDILQEVFMKYIKKDTDFESDEYLKAWLIRSTINSCKSLLRSAWFKKRVYEAEEVSSWLQEESEVYCEVLRLPRKYRIVIYLFYYEEYKIAEIAGLLKLNESTVKSQLRRARNLLKLKLQEGELYV